MATNLQELFNIFDAEGTFLSAAPFGSGHIHDTYRIVTKGSTTPDYILQRINNTIFRDVPNLQGNIELVTRHLRGKIIEIPGSDPTRQCLTLIQTRNGRPWHTDSSGDNWRMFVFIANHRSYDLVDSEPKAFEGGRAFGQFVAMLSDLPGDAVAETIPNFHNIEKRLVKFSETVAADPVGRVSGVAGEIEEILKRAEEMKIILRLGSTGKIPLRITHNDTKFNNVLLDEDDKALCVIDLDTVMPGYVHYDFGDAIRTGACTAEEDTTDLASVALSLPLFRAYTHGFLSETKDILTEVEKEWLAFAPRLITYEQALRFLADYIDGDTYYKTKYPDHNLQRTRVQLNLLRSMETHADIMKDIVRRYS